MRPLRNRLVVLLACMLATSCGGIKYSTPSVTPTASLSRLKIVAPPDANQSSATALDLVFLYDNSSTALLPSTGPAWFAQKQSRIGALGHSADVVNLQVPPSTVIDSVELPARAARAVAVVGFANYLSLEGQPRCDITKYHRAVILLSATQIQISEER